MTNLVDVRNIDWNAAWQAAQTESKPGSPYRKSEFWDGRAREFAAHQENKSDYPEQFIGLLGAEPDWTVLDVGCGPGTLALPLAGKVRSVTAMDFSREMLAILDERIREQGLSSIHPVLGGMEDNWENLDLKPHDLVIASRSMVARDLRSILEKLSRYARKKVCISTLVNPGPHDPRIIEAAGRVHRDGPDYIFIINQLHRMGIHARLDYTVHPVNRTFGSHEEALEDCRWMIRDMTDGEEEKLRQFFKDHLLRQNGHWMLPRKEPVRWAVISWDTGG